MFCANRQGELFIKTLLIVDDNDDLRTMLAYQLQAKGYRILMSGDGRQAVEMAKTSQPDLILLDVLMPGTDGTEASEVLKGHPLTQKIPIIFLTALVEGQESTNREGLSGNDTILPKSTPLDELVKKIELLTAKK